LVDDLVSTGEDIVDDAGSAVEDAGDALTGNDSKDDSSSQAQNTNAR
jgi:hypothetical protein